MPSGAGRGGGAIAVPTAIERPLGAVEAVAGVISVPIGGLDGVS